MAKNAFLQKSLGKYSLKILWEIFVLKFCILPDPLSIFKGQNPVLPSFSWMGVFSFLLGNFDERKKCVNFVNFEVSSR